MEERRGVKVRRATEEDAEALAAVGAETFIDSYDGQIAAQELARYVAETFGEEKQAAELAQEGSVYLLAEVDDEVAGYARLRAGESPESLVRLKAMELQRIYVRRKWIGKGVGAALMASCLREARQRRAQALWLGVWEQNERAIAFYYKWGFERTGAQEFQVGGETHRDLLLQLMID